MLNNWLGGAPKTYFALFASFQGINTPTMINPKLRAFCQLAFNIPKKFTVGFSNGWRPHYTRKNTVLHIYLLCY